MIKYNWGSILNDRVSAIAEFYLIFNKKYAIIKKKYQLFATYAINWLIFLLKYDKI